ncbi:MAG: hypothetical protein HY039_04310 [Nitrospirae bacterium]|nr:hypothetical protein [Nitrospirota bacterium]
MDAMRRSTRTAAGFLIVMTLAVAGLLGPAGKAVAGPKPDEPATGQIPTPTFTAPAKYQKFTLTPSLTVNLKADIPNVQTGYSVPGPWDFVVYAKASPFTEKWHLKVGKLDPNGDQMVGVTSAVGVQEFEGEIADYSFSISLNADWFKKRGPGKYGAIAYLSQTTSKGTSTGLADGVGFTIAEPPVKMSDQKPGNVVAKPSPGAIAALADAAKPNIAVGPAKVEITKNCKGPAPALIAAVTLKNTGGSALAAGQAQIRLRSIGYPYKLEGAADVPGIGVGETTTLSVPATSLQPFSSLVGSHQMELPLKPMFKVEGGGPTLGGGWDFGGFKEGPLYTFTVVFPAGHCGGKALVPPKPSSSTPNAITNPAELNPQPEVPSKPKKKSKPEREEKKLPAVQ